MSIDLVVLILGLLVKLHVYDFTVFLNLNKGLDPVFMIYAVLLQLIIIGAVIAVVRSSGIFMVITILCVRQEPLEEICSRLHFRESKFTAAVGNRFQPVPVGFIGKVYVTSFSCIFFFFPGRWLHWPLMNGECPKWTRGEA